MVCYDRTIFVNLESEGAKKLNIEKITFKVVQMKFLAMHITNQKLSFDIFMVEMYKISSWNMNLNILMIFVIKEKCIILTHTMYCCLLLQIAVLLMTAFVLQGHIYKHHKLKSEHICISTTISVYINIYMDVFFILLLYNALAICTHVCHANKVNRESESWTEGVV